MKLDYTRNELEIRLNCLHETAKRNSLDLFNIEHQAEKYRIYVAACNSEIAVIERALAKEK